MLPFTFSLCSSSLRIYNQSGRCGIKHSIKKNKAQWTVFEKSFPTPCFYYLPLNWFLFLPESWCLLCQKSNAKSHLDVPHCKILSEWEIDFKTALC